MSEEQPGSSQRPADVPRHRFAEKSSTPRQPASPTSSASGKVKLSARGVAVIFGLAAIVGGVLLFLIGGLLVGTDNVPRNTYVLGYNIGEMNKAAATSYLEEIFEARERTAFPFQVDVKGSEFVKVTPNEAGVSFDAAATVEQASGRIWNPLAGLGHLFGEVDVAPVVQVDESVLTDQVEQLALTVARDPKNPKISYSKSDKPKFKAGVPGRELTPDQAPVALVNTFSTPQSVGQLPMREVPAKVSDETAQQVYDTLAVPAVSAPVDVLVQGKRGSIDPSTIAEALTFKAKGDQLEPRLDGRILMNDIADLLEDVEKPAEDATFRIVNGKPEVVPSKDGEGVDPKDLSKDVLAVLPHIGQARNTAVEWGVIKPEFTTADAQALNIVEMMSTYTQGFPTAAYRTQNIGQAAEYINGTVLKPGEVFSLNEVIRERTEENGYTSGAAICDRGVFCEELGGGVSTSATATWVAAFYAGMEREHVQAHSRYISRYQAGLEATVNWGVFDMSFRNESKNGVFITSSANDSEITVTFWGTKDYDKITAEFGEREKVTKYPKIESSDAECTSQSGVDGFSITVTRVFWKNDERVREEPIKTVYKPTPEVTCVSSGGSSTPKPDDEPSEQPSEKPSEEPSEKPSKKADNSDDSDKKESSDESDTD